MAYLRVHGAVVGYDSRQEGKNCWCSEHAVSFPPVAGAPNACRDEAEDAHPHHRDRQNGLGHLLQPQVRQQSDSGLSEKHCSYVNQKMKLRKPIATTGIARTTSPTCCSNRWSKNHCGHMKENTSVSWRNNLQPLDSCQITEGPLVTADGLYRGAMRHPALDCKLHMDMCLQVSQKYMLLRS